MPHALASQLATTASSVSRTTSSLSECSSGCEFDLRAGSELSVLVRDGYDDRYARAILASGGGLTDSYTRIMNGRILSELGLLVTIGCAMGVLAQAELHTFTSKDGDRHFNGEVVSYESDKKLVHVRRDSGKLIKFSSDALSESDRNYVAEMSHKLAIRKQLRINASLEEEKKVVVTKLPLKTIIAKSYKVTLQNASSQVMKDLTVHYWTVLRQDDGTKKGEEDLIEKGITSISEILPSDEVIFSTDSVKVSSTSKTKDRIIALVLKVMKGKEEILRWPSNALLPNASTKKN